MKSALIIAAGLLVVSLTAVPAHAEIAWANSWEIGSPSGQASQYSTPGDLGRPVPANPASFSYDGQGGLNAADGAFSFVYPQSFSFPYVMIDYGEVENISTIGIEFSEDGGTNWSSVETLENFPMGISNTQVTYANLTTPYSLRDQADRVRISFLTDQSGGSITILGVANPEPGTFAMLGLGLLAIGGVARRRRNAKAQG